MARALQPHGTTAAYRRHLRASEIPCQECRRASADDRKRRLRESREREAALLRAAIAAEPPIGQIDVLQELLWNAQVVKAALRIAKPQAVAGLSKRWQELSAEIAKTQDLGSKSLLDQLAEVRRQRLAAMSDA